MNPWREILSLIERDGTAGMVTLAQAEGSTPREAGARMIVRRDGSIYGSIGGGPLEWNAIGAVKEMFVRAARDAVWKSIPLGPEIDQCCGGRASILHEVFTREDMGWIGRLAVFGEGEVFVTRTRRESGVYIRTVVSETRSPEMSFDESGDWLESFGEIKTPVLLFGAGHVGRALVKALNELPFSVHWIDSRPDAFENSDSGIVSALPESEFRDAQEGSFVLVMTHSHELDLALVAAALASEKFPYVGLIGSATKRALFERRLAEFGIAPEAIASLVCPIGVPGIAGKSPAVIAAAVAAELLQKREQFQRRVINTEIAVG